MNFRSLSDLVDAVSGNLERIPADIELIVGVPRSGMLPASIIALLTDKPLIDLESFLLGASPAQGTTRPIARIDDPARVRRILVVEDSISSGRSMNVVRGRLSEERPEIDATFLAVFAAPDTAHLVDLYLDICDLPRVFEWNLFNSWACEGGAFDLDGVFCKDPSEEENDDGPRYREFMKTTPATRVPGQRLHRIVTSRLEQYRPETEAWLAQSGIIYDRLEMLDGVTAAERREGAMHAPFKAKIYASDEAARIFVESDPGQAREIARLSGKPVLDFCNMALVDPTRLSLPYAVRQSEDVRRRGVAKLRRVAARLNRHLTSS